MFVGASPGALTAGEGNAEDVGSRTSEEVAAEVTPLPVVKAYSYCYSVCTGTLWLMYVVAG